MRSSRIFNCCGCEDPLAKAFDWGDGKFVLGANAEKVSSLTLANEIVAPYGLTADFLGTARSVGVGGDYRTYTQVIVLVGPHPGDETLASLSTRIGNETGINRITFELIKKSE